MNTNFLFSIFIIFPTAALTLAAWQNDGGIESYTPEEYQQILSKCCETTLKNESVDCNALAGGGMVEADALHFYKMVRQSGASKEQVLSYLFTCFFNNSASEDHSQCCIAANATQQCMLLCKGANGNDMSDPKEQLQRLREFFDDRQCSPYLMAALGGQICRPVPIGNNTIIDGIQQRVLVPMVVMGLVTYGAGLLVLALMG